MRALRLALAAGIAHVTVFGVAVPTSDYKPLLSTRGQQTCSNIPSVVAGTKAPTYPTSLQSRSLLSTVLSRGFPFPPGKISFCASGSFTFNVFQSPTDPEFGDVQHAVLGFLATTYVHLMNRIKDTGDGLIQSGGLYSEDRVGSINIKLFLGNANNHQLTLGVASAALQAMITFMRQAGAGPVSWQIWDGMNWVGRAGLQVARADGGSQSR